MITINEQERQIIVGALDTLGTSLAEHGHHWTEGERALYEDACKLLGARSPGTDNLCEGCGKPATTSDPEGVPLCDDCAKECDDDANES